MSKRNPNWLVRAASHLMVFVLRVSSKIVQWLPPRVWSWFAWCLSRILWYSLGRARRRTLENLERRMGLSAKEATRTGKASFYSNCMVLFESLAMERLVRRRGVHVEIVISPEAQRVLDALRSGESPLVLAISSHSGVWEFIGADLADRVSPVPVVVSSRLPKNPIVADYLRRLRQSFGLILIEKDNFLRHLFKAAKKKEPTLPVFLADQHFKRGLKVPFLGHPACTVPVPAMLINRYKAPTLVGGSIREAPGRYRLEMLALDLTKYEGLDSEEATRSITADINDIMGRYVMRAPSQWTWGHRRWRACCDEPDENTDG